MWPSKMLAKHSFVAASGSALRYPMPTPILMELMVNSKEGRLRTHFGCLQDLAYAPSSWSMLVGLHHITDAWPVLLDVIATVPGYFTPFG